MVRKQLQRTKPPAVPQGQPRSPARSRFPVLFRGDRSKRFLTQPPFLAVDRFREEKCTKGAEEPRQGKGRLLAGGDPKYLPGSKTKTRPARKNARNAAAGGEGAARQGAPDPRARRPFRSRRARTAAGLAGAAAEPPVPFSRDPDSVRSFGSA